MSRSVDRFTKIYHICIDRKGDRISEVFILTTGQKKESATIETASFGNLQLTTGILKTFFHTCFILY